MSDRSLPYGITVLLIAASAACAPGRAPQPVSAPRPTADAPPRRAATPAALLDPGKYDLPVEANAAVQAEMDFLLTQRRDVVASWLRRAEPYRDWVREVFASYGLPRDLANLGLVESGYQVKARSSAGAAGMWQFMSTTGRGMGLRVDDLVDERLDPVRATDAAARHLRDLRQAFGGDWPLALAAYNAGAGRISRALRATNATSYWELAQAGAIAEETRRYVPRLYALTVMANDPARFGFATPAGPVRPFAYDSVRVDVATPLSELARISGAPISELLDLNPHLLQGIAPAGYRVWVPASTGATVRRAFEASAFHRQGGLAEYRVRPGDDYTALAAFTGLPVATLRELNPRADPANLTRGQRLWLPAPMARALSARPGERAVVAAAPTETDAASQRATRRASTADDGPPVQRADTVTAAARADTAAAPRRRGTTASAPVTPRAEPAREAAPERARTRRQAEEAAPRRRHAGEAKNPRTFTHTVVQDETLAGLAARFDVSEARLRELNEMENNRVRPGQKLRVPRLGEDGSELEQPSTEAAPARSEGSARSGASAREDAPRRRASARDAGGSSVSGQTRARAAQRGEEPTERAAAKRPERREHVVAAGETLWGISRRYGVTVEQLRAANDLAEDAAIRPGQKLRIPPAR